MFSQSYSPSSNAKLYAKLSCLIYSCLSGPQDLSTSQITTALILVPTRELAQQVTKAIVSFSSYCANDVRAVNLTQKVADVVQRTWLAQSPDIVVATPARAAQCVNNSTLPLDRLSHLAIDEADLVLSYGYDEDLQVISKTIPKGVQTTLMSATLSTDVDTLKGLFCRDPVVVDFQESAKDAGGVTEYSVRCSEDDKFLLIYVIFKLKLVRGKCIIFVGNIDRCYRVKLFLEQFGIKSCVLNSELPVNSRIHVVEEFNKGVYDIIIASDEHEVVGERESPKKSASVAENAVAQENNEAYGKGDAPEEAETAFPQKKKRRKGKKDQEYGISRGIDFQNVAAVLNFDFPTSSKSYTHRIGRTARAGKTGMALSFIVPSELYNKHKATTFPTAKHDEQTLQEVTEQQAKKGKEVKAYHFDMKQVDAFRYRMNDALRAVTRVAVREARTTELRQELLKSEKLKRHFEENPDDLRYLRHDGELRAARIQPHLKHVPDYLMPSNGKQGIASGKDIGFVGLRKETDNRIRKARLEKQRGGKLGRKTATKRSDPLKTFNARGRGD